MLKELIGKTVKDIKYGYHTNGNDKMYIEFSDGTIVNIFAYINESPSSHWDSSAELKIKFDRKDNAND